MCGIAGAFGPDAASFHCTMKDALSALSHRGPDASGAYLSPDRACSLGHRRLSIVDLSALANQPMKREEAVLSYNGEIYNHQALRQRLGAVPYVTHSDTETLLHWLKENGPEALGAAEGMFAGAYYSETHRRLWLFRDPLGIKPLYYTIMPDSTLLFSSEIKGLLALAPQLSRKASPETLACYFHFENYPQGKSLFDGVRLLRPGEILQAHQENGRVTWRTFLLPEPPRKEAPPDDVLAQTRTLVTSAVQSHLMSDVPVGVYLSGGIDSSLVATLTAQKTEKVMAFTGRFEDKDAYYDETPISRLLAKKLNVPLLERTITPQDFVENFDRVIYGLDEPRMGMGAFSQYMVAELAGKHRKVILSGHGGDELFGGYPLFKAFWALDATRPAEVMKRAASLKKKEWPWFLLAAAGLGQNRVSFAPELYRVGKVCAEDRAAFTQPRADSPIAQLDAYYRETYLPGLLVIEDKISMSHSLETRVPLWSQALVRWASQIPMTQKMGSGELKQLLKQSFAPLLPAEVLHAPKRGFPTPLRNWFRGSLYSFAWERLVVRPSAVHQLVPRAKVARLLSRHRSVPLPFALDERRAHRIWMLLCLESWIRQFRVEVSA